MSPLLLFLSLFAFLFLGSCEKDTFSPDLIEKDAFESLSKSNQQTKTSHLVASETLQQAIKTSLLADSGNSDKGKDAEFSAILDEIFASPASKITSDDLDYDTYSYFVPTEDPSYLVNAIFSAKGDVLTGGYVHVFRMTSEFAAAFNSFSVDFSQFEGELGIRPLTSLKELIYTPGQKNGEDDCFSYILSLDPKGPDGGGGDTGDGVADGPRGTSGPIGGINGASNTCTSVIITECTCSPHHTVASSCSCHDQPGGQGPVIVTWTHPCPDDTFTSTTSTPEDDKNLSLEDCTELLASVGIVPRRLSLPDASEKTLEQISAAIAETCFDENAVMNMITPTTFEACYNLGTPGPVCLTEQVIHFLNTQNYPSGSIPGTPINVGISFDGLPHDQLATFLNAAVIANGNEHVLAGIYAARRNISQDFINSNLPLQILLLSKLSMQSSSEEDFFVLVEKYYTLIELSTLELKDSHFTWMVNNMNDVSLLLDFKDEHSNFDVDLYLDIMEKHHDEVILSRMLDSYIEWEPDGPPEEINPNEGQSPHVTYGPITVWDETQTNHIRIAHLPPRSNYNESDMGWGTRDPNELIEIIDGVETEIIRAPLRGQDELWRDMEYLFELSSFGPLDNVGEDFIQRFRNNTGGSHHNQNLSEYAIETQAVFTVFNYFGGWLNSALIAREGDINLIASLNEQLTAQQLRPQWSTWDHLAGGMTILVHDTYSTSFYILDAAIDEVNRTWEVTIGMEIVDHFGLDFEDVIKTQNRSILGQDVGLGFSAWWLLQHVHDFQPFESLIRGQRTLSGTY